MKLPLPAKAKSKDTLYAVVREDDLLIVFKNNTGLHYRLKEEEKEPLKDLQGVWHQAKSGQYKRCTEDLSLWQPLDYSAFPSDEFPKTATEVLDDALVPPKLRYKQPFKQQNWRGIKLITFPKYNQFTFISAPEHRSILEIFTQSTLDENILLLNANHEDALMEFQGFMSAAGDVLSIDTETFDPDEPNGWQALVGWLCNIRMLQVYSPLLNKTVIVDFGRRGQNASEDIRWKFGEILQKGVDKRETIFQNALFDLMVLEFQLGVTFYNSKIRDTMLMSKQAWAGIGQIAHNLAAICNRLGVGNPDKSLQKSDFGQALVPAQFNYGADDTILTYKCRVALEPKLREAGGNLKFAKIDNAYVNVAHMMRRFGMFIDQEALDDIYKKTEDYHNEKAAAWHDATGLTITAGKDALNEVGIITPNAQKGTLAALIDQYPHLKYRLDATIAKKRLDYLKGVRKSVEWKGNGCATPGMQVSARQGIGRTSQSDLVKGTSVGINAQNPAKENRDYPELPDYRPIFAAPPGYMFVSIDLSGSHARLAVRYAGCALALPTLQDGQDFHSFNASFIAAAAEPSTSPYYAALKAYQSLLTLRNLEDGEPLPAKLEAWLNHIINKYEVLTEFTIAEVLKDLKKAAKRYRDIAKEAVYTAINFGGAKRLQAALKARGIILNLEECKAIMDGLWEAIPEIRSYVKAKQKETNRMRGWKPEELKLLSPDEINWEELDEYEAKAMRKKPVEFGHLVTDCGFARYVPKYYQTGWKGKSYVSASITDVSASLWQPPEAKVIKMSQIRILHEYIIPSNYHVIDPSTGYPKVWIHLNAHDEIGLLAQDSLALEAATIQKRILDEEWEKECPGIAGTEGTPEDCIGDNWSESK